MWAPPVVEDAKACVEGLKNIDMLSSFDVLARSVQPGATGGGAATFSRLEIARDACLVQVGGRGRMQHGPRFAHANRKGDAIAMHPSGRHVVPKRPPQRLVQLPFGMPTATMALR